MYLENFHSLGSEMPLQTEAVKGLLQLVFSLFCHGTN